MKDLNILSRVQGFFVPKKSARWAMRIAFSAGGWMNGQPREVWYQYIPGFFGGALSPRTMAQADMLAAHVVQEYDLLDKKRGRWLTDNLRLELVRFDSAGMVTEKIEYNPAARLFPERKGKEKKPAKPAAVPGRCSHCGGPVDARGRHKSITVALVNRPPAEARH